jgi:hypothetical protein
MMRRRLLNTADAPAGTNVYSASPGPMWPASARAVPVDRRERVIKGECCRQVTVTSRLIQTLSALSSVSEAGLESFVHRSRSSRSIATQYCIVQRCTGLCITIGIVQHSTTL